MPIYITPESDTTRIAFLNSAVAAIEKDRAKNNTYVLEETAKKANERQSGRR